MKIQILLLATIFYSNSLPAQDTTDSTFNDTLMLKNIEISSLRASDKAPFTKTNISKAEIEKNNLGRDLPFLLNMTPSVIVSSDAGNGVGYTNIRIRGTDASRINVTLNSIPYNDAESQGTFFVDMPDIASSMQSIQIQRGVGTSSNGTGAFGASINLSTNEFNKKPYLELNNAFGSFNTWKNTLKAGTGLLDGHFLVDGRLSNITSDGYIDRASSSLQSFYVSGVYLNRKSSIRFNVISGREKTYQAWNGIPEEYLESNRTYNSSGTEKPGAPYSNETDNYTQTHYQLFYNQKINNHFSFNTAFFLTRGKGYYENYKGGEDLEDYFRPPVIENGDTLSATDLIVQDWLDNYFYGAIFSLQYAKGNTHLTFGGGYTIYDGGHYNIVKWAERGIPTPYQYIDNPASKRDANFYIKWMEQIYNGFYLFVDLQQRMVDYRIHGFEDHPDLEIDTDYSFFNPKAGVSWLHDNYHAYVSLSLATKEPNRDDFESAEGQLPVPERLYDWELALSKKEEKYFWGATLYYMKYKNQLVNTGKINDVGAYTRTNTPKSFRAGVELQAKWKPVNWLELEGNITFSSNKIKEFIEYIDDYDQGGQKVNQYTDTYISYSPAIVGAGALTFMPLKNGIITFESKYAGRQYLDNTSRIERSLDPYFVENMQLTYIFSPGIFEQIRCIFRINNLLDEKYEPNGYTYGYIYGGEHVVENFYFPMAGINFMGGINLKF